MTNKPIEINFRLACLADIDAIIKIQNAFCFTHKVENDGLNLRSGFIVHILQGENLYNFFTNIPELICLVCDGNEGILAYVLGMPFEYVRSTLPSMVFNRQVIEEDLRFSSFFIKQVVCSPLARPGTGRALSKIITEKAGALGYNYVLGEILKEPVFNKVSYIVHKRLGFSEIAEYEESFAGMNLKWGLFCKSLRGL